MKTKANYYLILFVYIFLWTCQLIACHLTHSLIILVDSYINLFKILEISLGILHLQTQHELRRRSSRDNGNSNLNGKDGSVSVEQQAISKQESNQDISQNLLAVRVFDRICTYQFKRLPLLGSFVNRLFLAALLMSAAIEGIQTCFHATHGANNGQSILLANPITYPAILVGFALVGAIMQWCSCKAHEMREQELESESLLNLNLSATSQKKAYTDGQQQVSINDKELSAGQLISADSGRTAMLKFEPYPPSPFLVGKRLSNSQRNMICLGSRAFSLCQQPTTTIHSTTNAKGDRGSKRKFVLNLSSRHRSFESVPTDSFGSEFRKAGQISLRSLKISGLNLESSPNNNTNNNLVAIQTISGPEAPYDLEAKQSVRANRHDTKSPQQTTAAHALPIIGYYISPVALVICALIVYFIHDSLATEIADASLAVLIVILLFTASYPPMKKAGRVLLQTAPDSVDLDRLSQSIKSASPLIVDIKELHVWSLTSSSNRVATCQVVLDREQITSEKQLSVLLQEIKFKFLDDNIKCSAIQPSFLDQDQSEKDEQDASIEANSSNKPTCA